MNSCEKALARLISTIVQYENQVEDARIELAKNYEFSPFHSFREINRSETGFVTEEDLDNFLEYYGMRFSKDNLRQFFSIDKEKIYKITYDNFLNQVLPKTDIDLRNACLEKTKLDPHKAVDPYLGEVGQLIATVYQKEVEYTRAVDANKNSLLSFEKFVIEDAFMRLADEITSSISFKSTSTFMKQNNISFGKKEYESLMRRIDRKHNGRVSPTEFKYQLFPQGILDRHKAVSFKDHSKQNMDPVFDGISPIKNWSNSPPKNLSQRNLEGPTSGQNERFSSFKKKQDKKPFETNAQSPYKEPRFSPEKRRGPSFDGRTSRNPMYNQEIATINNNLILQNIPNTSYYNKDAANPLEWRYLDPTYHNYWSYQADHNKTLSPDYFNKAKSYTISSGSKPGFHHSANGNKFVPFFNPSFTEPGSYENFQRYPDNPFRYTDHGHFFKNYYTGLRHNYFDKYYNFIPYQAKILPVKPEADLHKSRNSPSKSIDQARTDSPLRPNFHANPPRDREFSVNPNLFKPDHPTRDFNKSRVSPAESRDNSPFYRNYNPNRSPLKTQDEPPKNYRNSPTEEPRTSGQLNPEQDAPYEFIVVPNQQSRSDLPRQKGAIKIEEQPSKEAQKPQDEKLDKEFRKNRERPKDLDDMNTKPYTFVVVNK